MSSQWSTKRWIKSIKTLCALLIAGLCAFCARPASAEWLSVEGEPAKWGDIVEVALRDIHPTQPSVGFDRLYYKLGRYSKDRRKVFDEYCETNGQKGIRDFSFSAASDLHNPKTFACLEKVGANQDDMKTVVIAPDGNLYLTDGHHTFNAFWHMPEGGPDLHVFVIVSRDYRNFKTMDEFWQQMRAEKNIWLYDIYDKEIKAESLPKSLGLEHFVNDQYRSLMYYTKRIAWKSPGDIGAPDSKYQGDNYPDIPFTEFYWAREVRKTVDLGKYDLTKRDDYVAAIRAVGMAIINLRSTDVGNSGKSASEMGQFTAFNERELYRISRPGTGKLAYMLEYKNSKHAQAFHNKKIPN